MYLGAILCACDSNNIALETLDYWTTIKQLIRGLGYEKAVYNEIGWMCTNS